MPRRSERLRANGDRDSRDTNVNAPAEDQPSATGDPSTTFKLLELPAELRNLIYAEVVRTDKPIALGNRGSPGYETFCLARRLSALAINLLQANHQVRDEALAVYYETNAFHAHDIVRLQQWLESLSPIQIRKLKNVRLFTPTEWDPSAEERRREQLAATLRNFVTGQGPAVLRLDALYVPAIERDRWAWVRADQL